MNQERCSWCGDDPLYVDYHDNVWGRPVTDERELFAKLCLDGQQAGLSWITVLRKQEAYYELFDNFNPVLIARYGEDRVEALIQDQRIIRNRLKIEAIIKNAKGFLRIKQEEGSFSDYLWSFVNCKVITNQWSREQDVPTQTNESVAMSKALKRKGFSFVGPTICYAFMQAVGMVNDHLISCPAHRLCRQARIGE